MTVVVVAVAVGLGREFMLLALLWGGEHHAARNIYPTHGAGVPHPGAVGEGARLAVCRGANANRGSTVVMSLRTTSQPSRAPAAGRLARVPGRTLLARLEIVDWFFRGGH